MSKGGSEQDGSAIARQRIAREHQERTGFLDLGMLGLTELPEELFELRHLRALNLGAGWSDQGIWRKATGDIAPNGFASLADLSKLPDLQVLLMNRCYLDALSSIGDLQALQVLDCNGTRLSNLAPLQSLLYLRTLNCGFTLVRDLTPLQGLAALRFLDCSITQVGDLAPLKNLLALRSLNCSYTRIGNLKPLQGLTALESINCWHTCVSDLLPLQGLCSLQIVNCGLTDVSNLAPLTGLPVLRSLSCIITKVRDLVPLQSLTTLQTLDCGYSQVRDLAPLKDLSILQSLDCSGTQVGDLAPLQGLTTLQALDCSHSHVSDLAPLKDLSILQSLNCSGTQVGDLAPLKDLSVLRSLNCSGTQVCDLAPLKGLTALETLDCSHSQVSDLAPLKDLPALQSLNCSGCSLQGFPSWLLGKPALEKLVLFDGRIPGVPTAVLSQSGEDSCLEALRAHFADLGAGAAAVTDVKLMVLGNGRVGKTQLCRWLRDEPYDDTVPSTHGVLVTSAPLPGGTETRLNIWDFGGQDIYHGTHALFMRTSALFLLAWTPDLENVDNSVVDGIRLRNHPLAYWVDYVRHQAGAGSPVIVAQTRCDKPEDDAPCPVPEATLFDAFKFRKIRQFSAKKRRGTESLAESLREAVAWLREHDNQAVIGAGRYRVQQRLQQMLDTDAALPPEHRQHRKLTQDEFRQLCEEAGGISSRDYLLSYLHNAGTVFYREGLFGDDIILDQGWALDAIYAVFHREKSYKRILRRQGRFTRADLEDWVWQEHSDEEQKLFLSMMQSCGICFEHRRLGSASDGEIEYIAPDLLPERADLEHRLVQVWEPDSPTETATFRYPMLHPGLMRSIISTIGSAAGIDAEYWKGGIYVYETETRSRALIEETMLDSWRGDICIQTQRGQAALLLQRLIKLVEDQQSRASLTPSVTKTSAVREPSVPAVPLAFAQEPSPIPEWCVSYAWNDTTPEGRDREATVDRLCKEAQARGKTILRDKTVLGLGDSLAKFMRRIGSGGRVFVILSDKYLKSPACMFELSEIWRNSRLEGEEFVQRVRAFTLPCARIWESEDRLGYAIHWKNRYGKLEDLVKEHGYDILGEKDGQQFRLMKTFYGNVSDILATVADTLQPRSFADLMKYGFDDDDTA